MIPVDARALDNAEIDYLDTSKIRRTTVPDLTAAVLPTGPVILHIDLDVITPTDLPNVRVPAPGGPTATEVLAAAHRVLTTGQVIALDIACTWLPDTDPASTSTEVLANLCRYHESAC